MNFMSSLIVVKNMEASKKFYTELMGMSITIDMGANVVLNERLALQTLETWVGFIDKTPQDIHFGGDAAEVYFETEDLDAFIQKLEAWPEKIEQVNALKEFPWGQRSLHFYDPDGHVVEVGESMKTVTKRFLLNGMEVQQVQQRVMYPMPFVEMCRQELVQEGKL